MRVELTKSFTFEAAHFLPSFPDGHKCRRMHGHSFRVDVVVAGEIPAGEFHLIDFGEMMRLVEPLRRRLDHYCLNEVDGLENPTSEMIARWLWDRLRPDLPLIAEIVVHETCTSRCSYRGQ
jgi:6-pyruvoyltetrahydropterin/6-carboxytetrahydropterin synthase